MIWFVSTATFPVGFLKKKLIWPNSIIKLFLAENKNYQLFSEHPDAAFSMRDFSFELSNISSMSFWRPFSTCFWNWLHISLNVFLQKPSLLCSDISVRRLASYWHVMQFKDFQNVNAFLADHKTLCVKVKKKNTCLIPF